MEKGSSTNSEVTTPISSSSIANETPATTPTPSSSPQISSPNPRSMPQLQFGTAPNPLTTSNPNISTLNPTSRPYVASQVLTTVTTPSPHLSTMSEPSVRPYSLGYHALHIIRSHSYSTPMLGWYLYFDSFSTINHTLTLPSPNSFTTQALPGIHTPISQTLPHKYPYIQSRL